MKKIYRLLLLVIFGALALAAEYAGIYVARHAAISNTGEEVIVTAMTVLMICTCIHILVYGIQTAFFTPRIERSRRIASDLGNNGQKNIIDDESPNVLRARNYASYRGYTGKQFFVEMFFIPVIVGVMIPLVIIVHGGNVALLGYALHIAVVALVVVATFMAKKTAVDQYSLQSIFGIKLSQPVSGLTLHWPGLSRLELGTTGLIQGETSDPGIKKPESLKDSNKTTSWWSNFKIAVGIEDAPYEDDVPAESAEDTAKAETESERDPDAFVPNTQMTNREFDKINGMAFVIPVVHATGRVILDQEWQDMDVSSEAKLKAVKKQIQREIELQDLRTDLSPMRGDGKTFWIVVVRFRYVEGGFDYAVDTGFNRIETARQVLNDSLETLCQISGGGESPHWCRNNFGNISDFIQDKLEDLYGDPFRRKPERRRPVNPDDFHGITFDDVDVLRIDQPGEVEDELVNQVAAKFRANAAIIKAGADAETLVKIGAAKAEANRAFKLLEGLADVKVAKELAEIMQTDQGLAAERLRVARDFAKGGDKWFFSGGLSGVMETIAAFAQVSNSTKGSPGLPPGGGSGTTTSP